MIGLVRRIDVRQQRVAIQVLPVPNAVARIVRGLTQLRPHADLAHTDIV